MTANDGFPVEYDPQLVEEAVLLRIRRSHEEREFHNSRDRIYTLPDGETREKRFREFHAAWFVRMRLGEPVVEALQQQPLIGKHARRCLVVGARAGAEEGADLHVRRAAEAGERKTVVIRVTVARLAEASRIRPWLAHELLHVADMLDPAFGYAPGWPGEEGGPMGAQLLRERYRVLWDTWIDGRLARRGLLPETAREERLREFRAVFGGMGAQAQPVFDVVFDSDTQTHGGLIAMARPRGLECGAGGGSGPGSPGPCPLCRFPAGRLGDGGELEPAVTGLIQADFPAWRPQSGLCRQCADLYMARELSRAAEAALPRACT